MTFPRMHPCSSELTKSQLTFTSGEGNEDSFSNVCKRLTDERKEEWRKEILACATRMFPRSVLVGLGRKRKNHYRRDSSGKKGHIWFCAAF